MATLSRRSQFRCRARGSRTDKPVVFYGCGDRAIRSVGKHSVVGLIKIPPDGLAQGELSSKREHARSIREIAKPF
jgi:hypothetical protein